MECSHVKCNKKYDLKCLNIEIETFKAYTQAYKRKWICPECVSSLPKKGNTATPVRFCPSHQEKTPSPIDTITIQRGSQMQLSPTLDIDGQLLYELKQLRTEMVKRLEHQANAIQQLQNQFCETKTDLAKILNILSSLETKVEAQAIQSAQNMDNTMEFSQTCEATLPASAYCVQTLQTEGRKQPLKKPTSKPTLPTSSTLSSVPSTLTTEKAAANRQAKRGFKYEAKVGLGNSSNAMKIQATERKKHLHVWRLHPETTVEAMTDHISGICGSSVPVKIEKITHKTERDYSSFLIGVPETHFDTICQPEVWPKNAQFSEWTWFRKSTTKGKIY